MYHGAQPFFFTYCRPNETPEFYEWDVDPVTRNPIIPEEDLEDIRTLLTLEDEYVVQNPKFDVAAIRTIGIEPWLWFKTKDTLRASHLLASNQPHDLTSLAMIYLGINIKPYEDKLEVAVKEARKIAAKEFPDWRIAKAAEADMPSAKEKVWKFDSWLPRAVAKHLEYKEDHPWWTVLQNYGNVDSEVLIPLYEAMVDEIKRRDLWEIYLEVLKVLPVALDMETYGISLSGERLAERKKEFKKDSATAEAICLNIAKDDYGFDLVLPKGGTNNSLRTFIFDCMKLEPIVSKKKNKKTDAPSLDKAAIDYYHSMLDKRSHKFTFIDCLKTKRKRDTSISYMESYEKFWLPMGVWHLNPKTKKREQCWNLWFRLHPSLNPTGTDTLRWSCSNPNEQNISKQEDGNIRYCFGPAPGREWWSLDAANIELRIPAYEALEEVMIALFERPKDPPYYGSNHMLNFSVVYPKLWAQVLKEVGPEEIAATLKSRYKSTWQQWCKNGGFACQYGAMQPTADAAFHSTKYAREFGEGRDYSCFKRLKSKFAKLEAHNQWCIDHANKHGYVETIPDKTVNPRHGYPLLCTRSKWGAILPTVPLNYRTQGTAMWWMGKAMVRCHDYLQRLNETVPEEKEYHLIMQVHDELVFDFPQGKGKEPWRTNLPIINELKDLMMMGGDDIGVPVPVNVSYHADNWAEEIPIK